MSLPKIVIAELCMNDYVGKCDFILVFEYILPHITHNTKDVTRGCMLIIR
jgi:hypothetical protein